VNWRCGWSVAELTEFWMESDGVNCRWRVAETTL